MYIELRRVDDHLLDQALIRRADKCLVVFFRKRRGHLNLQFDLSDRLFPPITAVDALNDTDVIHRQIPLPAET